MGKAIGLQVKIVNSKLKKKRRMGKEFPPPKVIIYIVVLPVPTAYSRPWGSATPYRLK